MAVDKHTLKTTELIRIGELSERLNITTKTLRFYEKIGLIGPPDRSNSGYRLYNENHVKQTFLVVSLRRIGLTIDELKQLKVDTDKGLLRKSLSSILDQKLFTIDQDLGVLQGKREDLVVRFQALVTTPRERPPNCICDLLLINCTCSAIK
jgi:DNA-binding transcriptional MerR regulator